MDTITVDIPQKYKVSEHSYQLLQQYMEMAVEDGMELTEDNELNKELNNDQEFIDLHAKFSEKVDKLTLA